MVSAGNVAMPGWLEPVPLLQTAELLGILVDFAAAPDVIARHE